VRVFGAAGAVALVLAASACGGGGSSETTTAAAGSSPVQWANGVCSAFSTWKTSLESINVTSNPSRSTLEQAGKQVEDATKTLTQSLKSLGRPNTAAGQAAETGVQTLATVLTNDMNKIQETLKTKPPSAAAALQQVSTLTATLAAMAHNLTLAFGNLKKFDPSGELEKAFHQAKSCSEFVG
jgi:hypothetical protein